MVRYGGSSAQWNAIRILADNDPLINADIQFSAHSITFDANGGTSSMTVQTVAADTLETLKENSFTCEGHTFEGWNTEPDGTGTAYDDQAEVTLTDDLTLFAQWAEIVHTWGEAAYIWAENNSQVMATRVCTDDQLFRRRKRPKP